MTIYEYVNQAKNDIETAKRNYDYVSDPLLIDYYSYVIKANEVKLEYLLSKNYHS